MSNEIIGRTHNAQVVRALNSALTHFEWRGFLFLFCSRCFSSRSQTSSPAEGPRLCLPTGCASRWDAPTDLDGGWEPRVFSAGEFPRRPQLLSETLTKPAPALRRLYRPCHAHPDTRSHALLLHTQAGPHALPCHPRLGWNRSGDCRPKPGVSPEKPLSSLAPSAPLPLLPVLRSLTGC